MRKTMKTLSFINLKGGEGKTFISTNLAYLFGQDLKVLFVDNDKQGNASTWFGADPNHKTISDIFMYRENAQEVIQHTRYPNIDLIASDMGLVDANVKVIKQSEGRQDDILKNALADVKDQYDVCIIDNPPDINTSVFNSLVITDAVVIVSFPEYDSLAGVYKMMDVIEASKVFNPSLQVRGVLFNEFVSSPDCYTSIQEMEEKLPVFDSHIRYATPNAKKAMNRGRSQKLSIFEVMPQCGVARDLIAFAQEL